MRTPCSTLPRGQKRGFSDETIRKFGLGWSPSGRTFAGEPAAATLPRTALQNGYKAEYLLSTGLCYEHGGELVDKFRERVIFPIHSLSGRVIAFGGRTLREDKTVAKYLNSPESDIYHKSRSLYGIYFAKSAIAREQKCYLVEGYTDVISMHQAGIENVTASSGTSLTTDQIRLIKRFTNNVTVLYDGDAAGIKASLRIPTPSPVPIRGRRSWTSCRRTRPISLNSNTTCCPPPSSGILSARQS